MIAKPVHARRGNQRRDASEQLIGREQKEERPGARSLHAVDEPAVLALREALESEGAFDLGVSLTHRGGKIGGKNDLESLIERLESKLGSAPP